MGPNQISDAICLLANAGWVSWSCGGVTYTRLVPVCAPRSSAPERSIKKVTFIKSLITKGDQ